MKRVKRHLCAKSTSNCDTGELKGEEARSSSAYYYLPLSVLFVEVPVSLMAKTMGRGEEETKNSSRGIIRRKPKRSLTVDNIIISPPADCEEDDTMM